MPGHPLRRAAQYLRMSTEQQTYSLAYQRTAIAAYALSHGYEIVDTYEDAGVSGLTMRGRDGLRRLLADVLAGAAGFEAVIVYDVSRWGRFQDPDQAAHYEFLCREAGVRIVYCAESFVDQLGMPAMLMKHIKRAMAAEYSRELSEKIILSKRGVGLQGYWPGGSPPLGLRRSVTAAAGGPTRRFEAGERNAVKGERVRIVPGPAAEIRRVRQIFRLCVDEGLSPNAIARRLNVEYEVEAPGPVWTQQRVRRILRDELYVGVRIVGRAQVRLGVCERRPEGDWVRVPGAAQSIVSRQLFDAAQLRRPRRRDRTDAELIAELKMLLAETGVLSHKRIARDLRLASPSTYAKRFGGLAASYALAGFHPSAEQDRLTQQLAPHRPAGRPHAATLALTDAEVLARLTTLCQTAGMLSLELIEVTPGLPRARDLHRRFGSIGQIYRLIGYAPSPRQRVSLARRRRREGTDGAWDERDAPSRTRSPRDVEPR